MWSLKVIVAFVTLLCGVAGVATSAHAAPCCSAGAALPSLIAGDEVSQLSFSLARSQTVMSVSEGGDAVLRSGANADRIVVLKLGGSWRFDDRWQLGAGANLGMRQTAASGREYSSTRLGDAEISVAYEAIPVWNYSPWRPQGYLFLQNILPTGSSRYEALAASTVDPSNVTGQGVFQTSVGLALLKTWGSWDALLIPEARILHARTLGDTKLGITWGSSLSAGAGYSPGRGNVRLGLRVQPVYQASRSIGLPGESDRRDEGRWVWNSSVDVAYLASDEWMLAMSYLDQTWFGPARNVDLDRSFALTVQRKWLP